ncbi:MAG: hypothetical protein LBK95_07150 [Bifidobacteriaceae bacterium]|jgi:hypothetical protein|nr:hypothetical protein [Bifidobacteriaceae bacterium]
MNTPTATDQELARRFEEFDPSTAHLYVPGEDDLPPGVVLQRAMAARAYYAGLADQAMREAVQEARDNHMSWHKIGIVLGVTGEAVRRRWAA